MSNEKKSKIGFKPFHDFVIIEVEGKKEEVTTGGIIIASDAKEEKMHTGVVVEFGEDVPKILIKEGDVVYFSNFGGNELPTKLGNYRQIRFSEIYGKMD